MKGVNWQRGDFVAGHLPSEFGGLLPVQAVIFHPRSGAADLPPSAPISLSKLVR
jgi:hypothetical protein